MSRFTNSKPILKATDNHGIFFSVYGLWYKGSVDKVDIMNSLTIQAEVIVDLLGFFIPF